MGPAVTQVAGVRSLLMPIYEFRCEECGARFEGLYPAGTQSVACRECESERTARVLSAPGAPLHLVKTPAEARKQERKNAQLQASAKARFKEARRRARATRGRPPDGGSGSAA